ncbi:MAG: tRNA 2-thiouridine(34) synthase MnmA [Clostridia bacterium]|nr:tRNA 2-thiouridine(34) synthase MnmA [Clostridia bacterium]
MAKVLLGMSGGVDSTVSAALLKAAGHEVCGITFIMHGAGNDPEDCTLADGARRAAREVGIPLVVKDLRPLFLEKVITPFADAYFSGTTPNPCVLCNANIKFPEMLRYADENGFDFIATGHYASLTDIDGTLYISAAGDKAKDQTYFLYMLGQDVLSRLMLPLSGLSKDDVRRIASEKGLTCAAAKDSQDVCFIPDGDHAAYLSSLRPGSLKEGNFTDTEGNILGRHRGCAAYTVGQRKGLGIASDAPLFVQKIDPVSNTVVLCRSEELFRDRINVFDCKFPSGKIPDAPFRADVRIRYTRRSASALVIPSPDGMAQVIFDEPQRAPAPGQSAVFFLPETLGGSSDVEQYVFGGGIIAG